MSSPIRPSISPAPSARRRNTARPPPLVRRGDEDDDDGRTRQTTARVGDPIVTLPHDNGGTSKLRSRQALRTIRSNCVYVSQYFSLNYMSLNNRSRIIEITSRPFISPLSHLPLPLSAPLTIFSCFNLFIAISSAGDLSSSSLSTSSYSHLKSTTSDLQCSSVGPWGISPPYLSFNFYATSDPPKETFEFVKSEAFLSKYCDF